MDYYKDTNIAQISHIKNVWECQVLCTKNKLCQYFTYIIKEEKCDLKASNEGGQRYSRKTISGTRKCGTDQNVMYEISWLQRLLYREILVLV